MLEAEQKNLMVRTELQEEVIQQYHNITYHLQERGKEMLNILQYKKPDEDGNFNLSEKHYNKLLEIAHMTSKSRSFNELGILAEGSMDKIEQLKTIINKLK